MSARLNAEKPKNTKQTVGRLLHYIGRSGVILIALLSIMLLVTAADVIGPFFQAKAIDTIYKDEITGRLSVDLDSLWGFLITMAVVFAASAVLLASSVSNPLVFM
jgi:ATP-binding cassette subfamily B protein